MKPSDQLVVARADVQDRKDCGTTTPKSPTPKNVEASMEGDLKFEFEKRKSRDY